MAIDTEIMDTLLAMSYGAANGTIKGFSETCVVRLDLALSRLTLDQLYTLLDTTPSPPYDNYRDRDQYQVLRSRVKRKIEDRELGEAYDQQGC